MIIEIGAGYAEVLTQGKEVYLREVPAGEKVIHITWDAPENGIYLTAEDLVDLTNLWIRAVLVAGEIWPVDLK